jgi:hypothetical protein
MSAVRNILASVFFFAIVSGLIVLCTATAVTSLGRGEVATAVVVLGLALAFAGVEAAVILVLTGKVKPRLEVTDQETTIRPDLVIDRLLTWSTVAGFVAVAVYAIFAPQGKIDLPLPYGSQRMWTIAAIGITMTGIVNLWSLYKRGGNSFQRLTRQGFELGQGISSVRGEWDDVVDIADRRPGKPPPVRATLFVKFSDGKIRTQAIDSYTPRGAAMRRLVRYYWLNPDKRDELTDGRAIERLTEYQA